MKASLTVTVGFRLALFDKMAEEGDIPIGSAAKKQKTLNYLWGDTSTRDTTVGGISSTGPRTVEPRHFQPKWLDLHKSWLHYSEEKQLMFCKICVTHNKTNAFTTGTNNFRTSTLERHLKSAEHKSAVNAPQLKDDFEKATHRALNAEEEAVMIAMKCVYWLSKECIPLSKYGSLVSLLQELKVPNIDKLAVSGNTTYTSYYTATDFLHSISSVIDKDITDKLKKSPVLTVMTDESTDIVVHHKLCISARIIDPITLKPSTIFLSDVRITEATGKSIFNAIKEHLHTRGVNISSVMGLGTDGASTMTGKKEGLTGHFLRVNPHLQNTHCAAHRLALCTEQAAKSIDSMKEFQRTLEMIFYHFKKSATRGDNLEAIQKVLEEPVVKYREVHQVRWLSFYEALNSVYRTLASLITYFDNQCAVSGDATTKGIKTRVACELFISLVYAMLDILKPVMNLSLVFQKKDLDISLVPVKVEECLSTLMEVRDSDDTAGTSDRSDASILARLKEDLSGGTFKGHSVRKLRHPSAFTNVKTQFIDKVIENIKSRFPNNEFLQAFSVLAMRPISFLSEHELGKWQNESVELLAHFYGKEQSHNYKDPETKEDKVFKSPPLVDGPDVVMQEWRRAKTLVKSQQYPTSSFSDLWNIIATHHYEEFPNLMKLAMLALTHPIHTADCERAFSGQNRITTSLRNRLCPDNCDKLMKILLEGPQIKTFDFNSCLKEWRKQKLRKVFNYKDNKVN